MRSSDEEAKVLDISEGKRAVTDMHQRDSRTTVTAQKPASEINSKTPL